MAETATIGAGELEGLIASALIASRTAEANARSVARALAQAEIDGQKGHGLSRVPLYAEQARVGKVDGNATPIMRQTRPGSLILADNVIRDGKVAREDETDPLVKGVQEFNRKLATNPNLEAILVTIMREALDGLAIARVKDSEGGAEFDLA